MRERERTRTPGGRSARKFLAFPDFLSAPRRTASTQTRRPRPRQLNRGAFRKNAIVPVNARSNRVSRGSGEALKRASARAERD